MNNKKNTKSTFQTKSTPIGGFFKIGNEVFKVVRDEYGACSICEFSTSKCPSQIRCSIMRRTNSEVCFILYDTLEDNE